MKGLISSEIIIHAATILYEDRASVFKILPKTPTSGHLFYPTDHRHHEDWTFTVERSRRPRDEDEDDFDFKRFRPVAPLRNKQFITLKKIIHAANLVAATKLNWWMTNH